GHTRWFVLVQRKLLPLVPPQRTAWLRPVQSDVACGVPPGEGCACACGQGSHTRYRYPLTDLPKDRTMWMWTAWHVEPGGAAVAVAAIALILSVPLSHAAYQLPRVLNAQIPAQASRSHRRYRAVFWMAAPMLALLCTWRFGATPATVAATVFVLMLLTLAWIDAETGFLPD